jgi:competence transcription factor ComK
MKITNKNKFYSIIFLLLLTSCQSVKDGLTGKKNANTDEFLVQKKNPLILPPDFDKLPEPKNSNESKKNQNEYDLESILKNKSTTNKTTEVTKSKNSSLKDSILKKIKSN